VKKQQKALEVDTPKGKFTEEEREEFHRQQAEKEKAKGGLSGDPNRPYSRGRAYDPNRYGAAKEATSEEETARIPEAPEPEADTDSE